MLSSMEVNINTVTSKKYTGLGVILDDLKVRGSNQTLEYENLPYKLLREYLTEKGFYYPNTTKTLQALEALAKRNINLARKIKDITNQKEAKILIIAGTFLNYFYALSLDDQEKNAFLTKGLSFLEIRTDQRINLFRADLNPMATRFNNEGLAFSRSSRHQNAVESYERAIALEPNIPFFYHNLFLSLMSLFEFEKAVAAERKAVEFAPNIAEFKEELGFALYCNKGFVEAKDLFKAFFNALQESELKNHFFRNCASRCEKIVGMRLIQQSIQFCEDMLSFPEPENGDEKIAKLFLKHRLAGAYLDLQQPGKAFQVFEDSLRNDSGPDMPAHGMVTEYIILMLTISPFLFSDAAKKSEFVNHFCILHKSKIEVSLALKMLETYLVGMGGEKSVLENTDPLLRLVVDMKKGLQNA